MSNDQEIGNYSNPIIWDDLPDLEVIRVDDTYYCSASTFAFSPGAPVLKSYDLINWEYIGHSVPELTFGPDYYLDGTNPGAYVKGIWASTLGYRRSNGLFYWYGCIVGTQKTFIFTAKNPEGPWTGLQPIERFYYDAGVLIDKDDTMYIAYGSKTIQVAQLSRDGMSEIKCQPVHTAEDPIEGARMYNINGTYYIWITKPGDEQRVLKSGSGPFGPYECRQVALNMQAPVPGCAAPHQGALIDTPDGKWHYMAFVDAYPGGRIPVLAPIEFDEEGWPRILADYFNPRGLWRLQYRKPIETTKSVCPVGPYKVFFAGSKSLNHRWEWNHNPENDKWALGSDGLTLHTATVTKGLHLAANTLTHRILGPKSKGIFRVNAKNLTNGDRAGAVIFRDQSAYIGLHKDDGVIKVVYVKDINLDADWKVTSHGTVRDQGPVIEDVDQDIWLSVKADITPAFYGSAKTQTRYATFHYSTDGQKFTQLGSPFALSNSWEWYLGFRFGVFNFATKELGGSFLVKSFQLSRFN